MLSKQILRVFLVRISPVLAGGYGCHDCSLQLIMQIVNNQHLLPSGLLTCLHPPQTVDNWTVVLVRNLGIVLDLGFIFCFGCREHTGGFL